MEFIDLKSQLAGMRHNIDKRIATVLDHGQFIMGPEVQELETALADYVNVKHCVSCANGTDALQLALMALDIGPGDIVFTTAFSFFATAEVIPLVGATPYFVDIEPRSYNLCVDSLEAAILEAKSQRIGVPKAVIAVDMFGLPADYPKLQALCNQHGLFLIEDGAQSFGGAIGSQKCGSFGDIATTSFFPAKPLGCYGDGGAIFTNDDRLAELCRSMRVHGKGQHKYENVRIGLNSRLDTIQAAILLEKLTILDTERRAKNHIAQQYDQVIKGELTTPWVPEPLESAWAQYTLQGQPNSRDVWMKELNENGIPSAVYYPIPLNQQAALRHYPSVHTPVTDLACETVFSLPLHSALSAKDIELIGQILS